MSYSKRELTDVVRLCAEVADLAEKVIAEANEYTIWDTHSRQSVTRPQWPYWGGTKTSGAMRRKSMELTRALAELRKP